MRCLKGRLAVSMKISSHTYISGLRSWNECCADCGCWYKDLIHGRCSTSDVEQKLPEDFACRGRRVGYSVRLREITHPRRRLTCLSSKIKCVLAAQATEVLSFRACSELPFTD